MKIIEPSATIIDGINGAEILKKIERAARTCYQSFDKAGEGTAEKLAANCIKRGHESVIEHVSVSVKFVTDRAIHNEIVRHRLTAVSCESTRYCRYGDGIEVIVPEWMIGSEYFDYADDEEYKAKIGLYNQFLVWHDSVLTAEKAYQTMLSDGATPQEARCVLPLCLKCEYIVTANLREWRHIFKLRCSPAAHPEMRRVMNPLLSEFKLKIPVVFDDI